MVTWTSHECPDTALFASAIARLKTLSDEDKRQIYMYGLIADPGGVSFSEDLCMGRLENAEYSGPIFYCPWCGVWLGEPHAEV
jgi:hypothetical protein